MKIVWQKSNEWYISARTRGNFFKTFEEYTPLYTTQVTYINHPITSVTDKQSILLTIPTIKTYATDSSKSKHMGGFGLQRKCAASTLASSCIRHTSAGDFTHPHACFCSKRSHMMLMLCYQVLKRRQIFLGIKIEDITYWQENWPPVYLFQILDYALITRLYHTGGVGG